jgi:hypothetical protein
MSKKRLAFSANQNNVGNLDTEQLQWRCQYRVAIKEITRPLVREGAPQKQDRKF